MKIAIYSGDIPSTTFIERLISGLADSGHTIYLFGKQKRKVSYSGNIRIVSYHSNLSKGWMLLKYYLLLLIKRPAELRRLKKKLKAEDIVNYKHRLSISLPVLYHRPDVFHIQWAKATKDWMWVKDFGMKLILSLRGTHINYSPITIPGLAEMYRSTFPKVDGFHAVCDAISNKAVAYGAKNIKTIYSGLATNEYTFNPSVSKTDTLNVLSVGRWHWVKGYDYAINAMRLLKERAFNFHYTIIGGKETEEALFDIADMELEQHISFIDLVPHAALKEYFHSADVLLLPSVEEGIANVVLEAMAYGTVVITTDCGGMREAVQDGINGFIVPARDSQAMADKLMELAMLSKAQLDDIKAAARQTVETKFKAARMVADMAELYTSVL